MQPVRSTDGVEIAVYEIHAAAAPTLLISHATGFHGWCYAPFAEALGSSFRALAFDYRGHGDTAQPEGVATSWERYGDDVSAVAHALHGPLVAFGHSMGGACLLMAALRDPARFERLVLYEPIVPPAGMMMLGADPGKNPMAIAASRRRATFASHEEALYNYASKRPLNRWRADALQRYVSHGFRAVADGVTLKCTPQLEAATFAAASEQLWELLDQVEVPVTVLAGREDGTPPPAFAAPIAERIPNARFQRFEQWDHFGPMTHPDELASVLLEELR